MEHRFPAASSVCVSVIQLESPLCNRAVGPALARALYGVLHDRKDPMLSPSWLPQILSAVANADATCRDSVTWSLFSLLLSDEADGIWRVRRMGAPAPRADALTLDWVENSPTPVTTRTQDALDFEALLGTRVSLLTWNGQRRVVGVTEANRHFHQAPISMPPKSTASVASVNAQCAALGAALVQACQGAAHAGLAIDLARLLSDACVPLFLYSSSSTPTTRGGGGTFDWEQHAATLPRQRDTMTVDIFVDALFSQNPILWNILDAIQVAPLAASHCHAVTSALLCHYVGIWYAQRGRSSFSPESHPDALRTMRLFQWLKATMCLPPPLYYLDTLIPLVSPLEASTLLLACWRFCHRHPPKEEQYDAAGTSRRFPEEALQDLPALLQPIRVCIAAHVTTLPSSLISSWISL